MTMGRSVRRMIVPPLVATFAAYMQSGCFARPTGEYRTAYGTERYAPAPSQGFGYVTGGLIPYTQFFGELDDVEPGTGATVTFPLAPGLLAVALVVVILAAAADGGADIDLGDWGDGGGGGGGDDGIWHSGVSDQSRVVLSEFSLDFTFSTAHYRDEVFGGGLNYTSFLLGARVGGPRRYVPRYYFTGGWGWHGMHYGSRPDAHVSGPYVGGGIELFADPDVTLGLDYKVHFYVNPENEAGDPLRGACGQVGVVLAKYF